MAGHKRDWGTSALLAGLLSMACQAKGAASPAEAQRRLAEAVTARDAARLFDALDQDTRWSWMSVQRAHREAWDIILSTFPQNPERERQLERFEAGAHAEDARALFVRELDPGVWTQIEEATSGSLAAKGPLEAEARGASGRPVLFRRDAAGKWGWGFAGLAAQAENLKRRAIADLEVVRSSGSDYERAAVRQGR